METTLTWLANNWPVALAIFYIAEKAVKLSPTKADDILVDIVIKWILKKLKLSR